MRALVIDDAKAARTFLRMILEDLGFETVEAENGRAAINRLRVDSNIDVAFVDLNMPQMDGLEFIRQIRQDSLYSTLKLITVTTETSKDKIAETLQAGANEYVMKPYTKEVVQEKLIVAGINQA